MNTPLHDRVRDYYERKLAAHGATPSGVDWNSHESQELRFDRLAVLLNDERQASVLDMGCGYGAMLGWLRRRGFTGPYIGYDVSPEMARAGERAASQAGQLEWRFVSDRSVLPVVDFVIASGIFNVKMETAVDEWRDYVLATIDDMAGLCRRGFAFNVLTSYSDSDRQRPDLYYANPLELFDYCKRRHSRFVSLLHDYPLYEFTLIVRRP